MIVLDTYYRDTARPWDRENLAVVSLVNAASLKLGGGRVLQIVILSCRKNSPLQDK